MSPCVPPCSTGLTDVNTQMHKTAGFPFARATLWIHRHTSRHVTPYTQETLFHQKYKLCYQGCPPTPPLLPTRHTHTLLSFFSFSFVSVFFSFVYFFLSVSRHLVGRFLTSRLSLKLASYNCHHGHQVLLMSLCKFHKRKWPLNLSAYLVFFFLSFCLSVSLSVCLIWLSVCL